MTIAHSSLRRQPLVLAIALALAAASGHAAMISVTSQADDNGSGCTLREAIQAITDGKNENGCSNSSSSDGFGTNDTIAFDISTVLSDSTVTLSLGQLTVSSLTAPLTIQGSGQTIDANNQDRVLYAESSTLMVSSLTLTGGSAPRGGGVYLSYGAVTLTNSTVSGNSASSLGGGVYARYGTVTLTNSTVSGNSAGIEGGGVHTRQGTVTLTNSTVSGNSAVETGGGVFASDVTVTLTNSTVSGNSAYYFLGGGVFARYGTVTLVNSTVSGNSDNRGGGVFASDGTVTLTNSTVSGNSAVETGGGVFALRETITLTNSILSGNTATSGPDLYSDASSETATYSLLGTALDTVPFNSAPEHNIFYDNPLLNPLQDNGGPTLTMALILSPAESPAVDAGSVAAAKDPTTGYSLSFDQRGIGFPRTLAGHVDIGAFQHQPTDRIFADPFESGP